MNIRPAAVAGRFYEADKNQLISSIAQLMEAKQNSSTDKPKALIVPHAGYIYSGSVAAQAYQALNPYHNDYKRIILLGPAHRVYLEGMALPSVDAFNTPLGDIRLDREAIDSISAFPAVTVSDRAHQFEHSLEVQLPFLQSVFNEFSLIPIVVGQCAAEKVAVVIDRLTELPENLVIISSDLSHFHGYDQAKKIDAATCDRILQKTTHLIGEEACGAMAINGLMHSNFAQPLSIELLAACNSGDTAGDKTRVVGYGSFLLH